MKKQQIAVTNEVQTQFSLYPELMAPILIGSPDWLERIPDVPGCYLIHLNPQLKHARHYSGCTEVSLRWRIKTHFDGKGSAMLRHVVKNTKIQLWVVGLWVGAGFDFEGRFKAQRNSPQYCHVCQGAVDIEHSGPRGCDDVQFMSTHVPYAAGFGLNF